MKQITIKGKKYPSYPTMGAMTRFYDLTGHNLGEDGAASDMVKYMYCCCKSACVREGVEFPFDDDQTFADSLLPEEFNAWAESLADDEDTAKGEKKRKSASKS